MYHIHVSQNSLLIDINVHKFSGVTVLKGKNFTCRHSLTRNNSHFATLPELILSHV